MMDGGKDGYSVVVRVLYCTVLVLWISYGGGGMGRAVIVRASGAVKGMNDNTCTIV